jgi:hypothetical protein
MASFYNIVKLEIYVSRYFDPELALTYLAKELKKTKVTEMTLFMRLALHNVTPDAKNWFLGHEMFEFRLTRDGDSWK